MRNLITAILVLVVSVPLFAENVGEWKKGAAGHSEVRLISEFQMISNATSAVRLGLEFKLDKGWHVYWKNPGEVGFPPKLSWTLSPAWTATEILFPAPERIAGDGKSESFGYIRHVIYPTALQRSDQSPGALVAKAHLDYLICDVQCVPESADFNLTLFTEKSEKERKSNDYSLIDRGFRLLPETAPVRSSRHTTLSDKTLVLDLSDLNQKIEDVFVAAMGPKQKIESKALEGSSDQWKISSDVPLKNIEWTATYKNAEGLTGAKGVIELLPAQTSLAFSWSALLIALALAFLGGAILNLMPCVLPVVVLKTVSLMNLRAKAQSLRLSLTYTIAGILFSFACLAITTIALKRIGQEIGWGFQFQNPFFILAMILLIFLFALNLFDLFQFSLSSSANSRMAQARSPFLEGIFATLLATPCSAPFLGTALTFALAQSASVLFLFYMVMGLGLSLPYILLLVSPRLLSWFPKPGAWMEKLKSILGYSLLFTVIWLLYVLHQQVGSLVAFEVLVGLFGIFVFLRESKSPWRWALVLILAFVCFQAIQLPTSEKTSLNAEYSEAALSKRLDQNERLFVVVTADWCLTCKYNEKFVIDTDWFQAALREKRISLVTYDWTQRNESISQFLKKYGRVGIPFAMLIDRSRSFVFPELLTRTVVETELQKF